MEFGQIPKVGITEDHGWRFTANRLLISKQLLCSPRLCRGVSKDRVADAETTPLAGTPFHRDSTTHHHATSVTGTPSQRLTAQA